MLINFALVVAAALLGKVVCNRIGLPGILGMVLAGVLLGGSGFDLIAADVIALLIEFKTIALVVILIRAGLGISRATLNRVGAAAVRMGVLPAALEGAVVALAGHWLLGLPWLAAGLLGFILAAVSPAVVVPQMLNLRDNGFGSRREVPTLILAGASADNVFALTAIGVLIGIAAGAGIDAGYLLLRIPAGIAIGALVGALLGLAMAWLFERLPLPAPVQALTFIAAALLLYAAAELPAVKQVLPLAALLGIMAAGFVILERNSVMAHRLARSFQTIWVPAELLLFVCIGAEVRLDELSPALLGTGMAVLCAGLVARSAGVWLALLGTDLDRRERLFCVVAYVPKATVQAAMGAVPLALIIDGTISSISASGGQDILAVAVLAIVVTTPLGAMGIRHFGPRLLRQD